MSNASKTESSTDSLLENGKNKTNIYCQRCPSLVLSSQNAVLTEKEFYLPYMHKKKDKEPFDGETLKDYWVVQDMYTFDNMGFSNTVGTTKYLICADCEIGPIGWHDTSDKKAFYIAVDRVKHGS